MKISTKGRYGLRAVIDIAIHGENEPVPLGAIAIRQDISMSYLEQLIAKLKRADIVTSVREQREDIPLRYRQTGFRWGIFCVPWKETWRRSIVQRLWKTAPPVRSQDNVFRKLFGSGSATASIMRSITLCFQIFLPMRTPMQIKMAAADGWQS